MENTNQKANPTVTNPFGFSDIYINLQNPTESDVYYIGHNTRYTVSKEQGDLVMELRALIIDKLDQGLKSFRLRYRDRLFRCTIINSIRGKIGDLRSQPMEMIPLAKIGIPPIIKQYCLSQRLNKGGLILVVGAPGQGKTTTCAALLLQRLERYGGLCLAIEDPAELPLDGVHGLGRCMQIEIAGKDEYLEVGRMAMRCYPSDKQGLMFISEIRDGEGAALALRASLDGRLVIATMHADSVTTALKRIISMASTVMDGTAATQLLYNGFRLCLHQNRNEKEIKSSILLDTGAAVQLIGQGKFDQLNSEIDRQKTAIEQNSPIQTRQLI